MSDLQQLLVGVTLVVIATGLLTVWVPRGGKMAWFVEKPVLETGASLLLITTFAVGLVLLASRFTTIDNISMSGKLENAVGR
jgi:hypothetical protein